MDALFREMEVENPFHVLQLYINSVKEDLALSLNLDT